MIEMLIEIHCRLVEIK